MNTTDAVIGKNGLATTPGNITVYRFHKATTEYISPATEYLAEGVGIPADTCTDAPPDAKAGFAIVRNAENTAWQLVPDHRGDTVYLKSTGQAFVVSLPGDYSEDVTTQAPLTIYDKWDGSAWVTDTAAQHAADVAVAEQQKATLLSAAQETISLWQTDLLLGTITDENRLKLIAWRQYMEDVRAVDVAVAPDLVWPSHPVI
ncbi:phage tail fiber protein [Trabulsiella guamensis ATCC 49490]|uniref:Phage tail fiber protein n=1 Tax=Trabulsiella guamensis ATCC 49490 TaxID=1005994 RepID=A0A085AFN2_9ENTR|nr:tail fiber assembly protein [Trabulsiella guamensis]KFC09027.1 phage tail fiber protein [Trabulsiella guamensis ATCC 49490]